MINLRDNYWAVEVPNKYAQITIDPIGPVLMWWSFEGTETRVNLPPGTWQIVCTSKEVTEEQLIEVIPEMKVGKRYQNYSSDYPVWYHSRRESLRSLLNSKGCDLNKTYLILKKQ